MGDLGLRGQDEPSRLAAARPAAARLRAWLVMPLMAAALVLGVPPKVSAATIQIGTFSWQDVTEEEDEFLFFCESTAPCSRFTLTNDLDDLTDAELAEIGLSSSDAAFDDVHMPGAVAGSLGSLTAAIGSFVWITQGPLDVVSVTFQLFSGLSGTLVFPTLTGVSGAPVPIFFETTTPTPVPEPTTLALLSAGLVTALLRRRSLSVRAC